MTLILLCRYKNVMHGFPKESPS